MAKDFLTNTDFKIDSNPLWKTLENNYNKYFLKHKGAKKQRIPKKIHQVWMGGELPIKYFRLIRTWIDKHPDWEYKLWTDKDVESFGLVNKKLFDTVNNNGLRSDIFRYEILNRHGGIYLDTDFKCIKPFDDFLHLDFFTGNGHTEAPYAFCGLFGTYPENPLMMDIIKALQSKLGENPESYGDMIKFSDVFSERALNYMKDTKDKAVIFPKNFFYPFPPEKRDVADVQKNRNLSSITPYITDDTYCVHLWFTSWQWETQIVEHKPILPAPVKKKPQALKSGENTLSFFLKTHGDGSL